MLCENVCAYSSNNGHVFFLLKLSEISPQVLSNSLWLCLQRKAFTHCTVNYKKLNGFPFNTGFVNLPLRQKRILFLKSSRQIAQMFLSALSSPFLSSTKQHKFSIINYGLLSAFVWLHLKSVWRFLKETCDLLHSCWLGLM